MRREALFKLEEYESAKACFQQGAQRSPSTSQFATWLRKCDAELEEEGGSVPPAPPAAGAVACKP
jgi:hypothetical protein